jgi:hypothetical protein
MIKKAITGMLAGACILTAAGTAGAAMEVNIYGASAQYEFWTAAAPAFLLSQGCAAADVYTALGSVSDRDNGIAICAGTEALNGITGAGIGGETYVVRYSTNASYDGIRSVQGLNPEGVDPSCEDDERLMGDAATAAYTNWDGSTENSGTVTSTVCADVTVGASDVAAETFQQKSSGYKKGHLSEVEDPENPGSYLGGDIMGRDISGLTMNPDYNVYRPIIVPFSFFGNAGPVGAPEQGIPFDNITRLMATSIFSGQVTNWQDFDPSVADQEVVVCLRHAGSGTHATLDAAIMRGEATLPNQEINSSNRLYSRGLSPRIWFNNGSSDEMRCVGQNPGAIGYADTDKMGTSIVNHKWSSPVDPANDKGDVKRLSYQGIDANKTAIANGQYIFWSAQWLYASNEEPASVLNVVEALNTFASNPANLPAKKAAFWATQDEMNVEKATDFSMPSYK